MAGKQKGKDDARYLWPEFSRLIGLSKPYWVVIENVVGLLRLEFENVCADLESQGYETLPLVIPACAVNAPHRRDRVWIIANLIGRGCKSSTDNWQKRFLHDHQKWDITQTHADWEKRKPKSWETYTVKDWLDFNTLSSGDDDGLSKRLDGDRIRALGNAIVPQVAYVILKKIADIEKEMQNYNTSPIIL